MSLSLITPEAHAVNHGLPPAHLSHGPPRLPLALEAAQRMKYVQNVAPPRREIRPDTPEQPINLGLRFQQLKNAIRGDDQIESATQGKVGDVAELCPGFSRGHTWRLQLLAAAREHSRGPIDAVDKAARCRQQEQHPASSAPSFQHESLPLYELAKSLAANTSFVWLPANEGTFAAAPLVTCQSG